MDARNRFYRPTHCIIRASDGTYVLTSGGQDYGRLREYISTHPLFCDAFEALMRLEREAAATAFLG